MKALVIINERAGSLSAETVERSIRSALPKKLQNDVEILVTSDTDAMKTAIAEAQTTLDRVIAAGGDGTVTEVISAILPYPHLQLGIIPVGTGNRLACNLGIPTNIRGALDTALTGIPHRIDIGRINDRYFSLMAGVGLDAEIMAEVNPFEKRTMGMLAYFWKGVQRAFRTPYAIFEIEADGQFLRCRGIGVVIANAGNLLGRYFTLTPGAQPDDGLFDLCVLASKRRTDYWTTIIQILSQQHRGIADKGMRHMRASRITIRSRPKVKAQADGDVIGTTPIEIEALPNAIAVLVPDLKRPPTAMDGLTESIHHISDHLRLVIRDLFHI
jgi:diacylglycerol kinase (ATP)